jgi:hypothetical protein
MKQTIRISVAACAIAGLAISPPTPSSAQAVLNTAAISAALGRSGTAMPGDVYRVAFPRSDLHVRIGNVVLAPGLALGGYAAFKMEGNTTLAVGDLVLLENEIAPVMQILEGAGFQITALHNHLRGETPHVMYMHFMGAGDAATLASELDYALVLTRTPMGQPKPANSAMPWFATAIQQGLGYQGKASNGILSISVPRAEAITMQGYAIPPAMGVAIAMNFQAVGSAAVATTGDFVLITSEVAPVEQALRAHAFDVTALHHHMLGDEPRLYYMHFWSVQSPSLIAAGLKAALSHVNVSVPR